MKLIQRLAVLMQMQGSEFVTGLYRELLNREPEPDGLRVHAGELAAGTSRMTLFHKILHSAEANKYLYESQSFQDSSDSMKVIHILHKMIRRPGSEFIKDLYQQLLMRDPDSDGLQAYLNAIETGASKLDVISSVLSSTEAQQLLISLSNVQKTENTQFETYVRYMFDRSAMTSTEFVDLSPNKYKLTREDVRLIAFYLPQFYPTPENDSWWGKGFTEWTNVTRAVPQYVGHHQPQLPIDVGFYDLRLTEVIERQIQLAENYGVFGFCFYHYWFGGKRILDKPVENFLANRSLDFPFCLCWPNENWSRTWSGLPEDVLLGQKYSFEDDLRFIQDLARYIQDERYIRVNRKPLIIVYRPNLLTSPPKTIQIWRDYCARSGIGEIFLVGAKTCGVQDLTQLGFDAAVEFPPHVMYAGEITDKVKILNPNFAGKIYDYEMHVRSKRYLSDSHCLTFKTVCPGWDNTPRRPNNAHIFYGANPTLYEEWLTNVILYTKKNHDKHTQFAFINAWNEWGEGAHLEPDSRYGYAYLEATRNALMKSKDIGL